MQQLQGSKIILALALVGVVAAANPRCDTTSTTDGVTATLTTYGTVGVSLKKDKKCDLTIVGPPTGDLKVKVTPTFTVAECTVTQVLIDSDGKEGSSTASTSATASESAAGTVTKPASIRFTATALADDKGASFAITQGYVKLNSAATLAAASIASLAYMAL